jgi:hypothetical protein
VFRKEEGKKAKIKESWVSWFAAYYLGLWVGVYLKVRDGFPGIKIGGTRDVFLARQLLPLQIAISERDTFQRRILEYRPGGFESATRFAKSSLGVVGYILGSATRF